MSEKDSCSGSEEDDIVPTRSQRQRTRSSRLKDSVVNDTVFCDPSSKLMHAMNFQVPIGLHMYGMHQLLVDLHAHATLELHVRTTTIGFIEYS
jgi:hypothetical protein